MTSLRPRVSHARRGRRGARHHGRAAVAAMLLGRSDEPGGRTVVTVRLWDEQVAAAYRDSFAEFTREHPDIEVRVNVVAYSTYFDTLRTDVAGGGADDIFWLHNAYFAGYADSGRLMDIAETLGANASGVGALGGQPVHPQRHAVGGAAAHRRRHRAVLQRRPARGRGCGTARADRAALVTRRRRHAAATAGPADGRRRRTRPPAHRDSTPTGSASGATTRPTICRASTSTTSARPAGCSPSATGSRSTTRSRPRRSNTWCG